MKNLNKKGFTLIELLAVITIMGVLMIVAIPTVSRTIENTRRDTFLDTAKQYVNGVKTMWLSDSLECESEYDEDEYYSVSELGTGFYYVKINSSKIRQNAAGPGTLYPVILESGGKSSWGSSDVSGYVIIESYVEDNVMKQDYYIRLTDNNHGIIDTTIEYSQLKRGNVLVSAPTGESLKRVTEPDSSFLRDSDFYTQEPMYCREV